MSPDPQFAEPDPRDESAADPGRQAENDPLSIVADDRTDIDPDDEYEAL